MKLTANQIRAIYRAIADLYGMINTERINQGADPTDDEVYNELNIVYLKVKAIYSTTIDGKGVIDGKLKFSWGLLPQK
jgi:hypothetical protein